MLALQTRSPILPVWITYGEKRRFRYPVTLRFGEMITDAQTMQQTDRSAIRQLMATLTKTMEGLAGG
jgi:1-acyl-sn-glycerol-3-phosphate acyltransferase